MKSSHQQAPTHTRLWLVIKRLTLSFSFKAHTPNWVSYDLQPDYTDSESGISFDASTCKEKTKVDEAESVTKLRKLYETEDLVHEQEDEEEEDPIW